MKRLFILSALLAIIVYIKCDGETCLTKTGNELTEEDCTSLTTSGTNKECHVKEDKKGCEEKDATQTGGNTGKDNTGTGKSDKEKTESSKSSSSSSMIKISLFLLISMLFI